TSYFCDTAIQ
ncbi:hypothetical protein EE612_054325, partial [Oryza sativa]